MERRGTVLDRIDRGVRKNRRRAAIAERRPAYIDIDLIDPNLRYQLKEYNKTTPWVQAETKDRDRLPWEDYQKIRQYGTYDAVRDVIRGGARWRSAREALTMGMNGHDPMADESLNIPMNRHNNVFEPIRRAAVEAGVFHPVNHFRRKYGVKDRMKDVARVSRRDLMCLQRYKGDYAQPPIPVSWEPYNQPDTKLMTKAVLSWK